MLPWMLATVSTLLLLGQDKGTEPPATKPAESQPSTQPAGSSLRGPQQIQVLKGLLDSKDRATPVRPEPQPKKGAESAPSTGSDGTDLLLEGTFLSERPGRLVHEGGRAKFVFNADGGGQSPRSLEVLENQLLEAMEREAEAGFASFVVSGEVSRYRGRNFLLLRKILRRVDHGNLGP
jgi:hypothetical protein